MKGRDVEFLINKLISENNQQIKVSIPALVVGVQNLKDGLIDVLPLVNSKSKHTLEYYEHGVLEGIRVIFPSNSQSTICFPIKQGDTVDLVFKSSSISSFINGNKEQHNPSQTFNQNMLDCAAYVGFQTHQDSCFNANNYADEFDMESLNIVHNKNTERESKLELTSSGDINLITNNNVKVKCNSVDINADTIKTNKSLIIVDNDIVLNGVSLTDFINKHNHRYTDDGIPMNTDPPNPL